VAQFYIFIQFSIQLQACEFTQDLSYSPKNHEYHLGYPAANCLLA